MECDQPEEKWDWESKDKILKKHILNNGPCNGSRPIEGSTCKIVVNKIEGKWDNDIKEGVETSFVIGSGDTRTEGFLERCLLTMDKDEEALLQLGEVRCTVKLMEYNSPEVPEYSFDLEDTLRTVNYHKNVGVEHFKNGRTTEAYSRFKRAIRLVIFAGKTEEKVLPLYITVCNNIALCHLKLNRPELGIAVCNKVLDHDAYNVKGLLRRAACYNHVRDFEKAYADLLKVLEIEPNNPTAKEMMPPLKADIHDMNKRYKCMVQKMFNYA